LRGNPAKRLRGQRILLFKPSFGISTPWAYRQMAMEAPRHYLPSPQAEERLSWWLADPVPFSSLLFNNMEGVAFDKFVALPVMLRKLRAEFGVEARMSGSGSTCFAVIDGIAANLSNIPLQKTGAEAESDLVTQMKHLIRQGWGEGVFIQEASLV
jgi:4-diphosphocytidyl-2C-methyl-D-erythritol kinase